MKITINPSDLMIVNRALAHDAMPKDKAFFIDSEGKYVAYYKRKPSIMLAKETTKDIEASANKMLRSLQPQDARNLRLKHAGESKARDRHLKIVVDLVSKYSSVDELRKFAPNILKII